MTKGPSRTRNRKSRRISKQPPKTSREPQAPSNLKAPPDVGRFLALSPDLHAVSNFDGCFEYVNPAWEHMLGYSAEELLGKPWLDFIHPDDREMAAREAGKLAEGGTTSHFENRFRCKGGGYKWFEWSATSIPKERFYYATARDITEQKQTTNAIEDVAQQISRTTGPRFFEELVERLSNVLGVAYVMVGELHPGREGVIKTVAVATSGQIGEEIEYDLAGTPCEHVMDRHLCSHPENIQQLFPKDALLQEMNAQSYVGTPLVGTSGEVLGLMAVLDTKPIPDARLAERILSLFATRAAVELERMRTEEALRSSEEMFRRLVDSSMDGILAYDLNFCYTLWNPGMERISGIPSKDVLGRNAFELFPFLEEVGEAQGFREALRGKEWTRSDMHYDIPDPGKSGYFESAHVPLIDAGGNIIGGMAIIRDITVRRRVEEERRKVEEKHRLVLEHIDEVVYMLRIMTWSPFRAHPEYISDRVVEILGFTPEELFSDPELFYRQVHPDDRNLIASIHEEIRQTKLPTVCTYRVCKKNTREYIHLEDRVTPQLDVNGEVVGLFGVCRDVTELIQTLEAVRDSEERFRSLVQNSNDIITVLDEEGLVRYQSPSVERYLGYSPEELIGNSAFGQVHPDDRQPMMEAWKRLMGRGGVSSLVRFRSRHKDGSWRTLESMGTVLPGETSLPGPLVINSRDITDKINLEEQLRQSQKMEAVGRLAGGIAHDFNNLLQVILGHTQFLSQSVAGEGYEGSLHEIKRAADRAALLTQQLLAFSRRQVLLPQVIDLGAVIQDLESMVRRLVPESIDLTFTLRSRGKLVLADPNQVEQVVMNLVVNAIDATPRGGHVEISTSLVDLESPTKLLGDEAAPGSYVVLTVHDSGAGIDPTALPNIFEPFFTTKEIGKGTGLGLATVYGIVRQSNGYIDVESELHGGTAFRIYLPVCPERSPKSAQFSRNPTILHGTGTILLVEDESGVRGVVRRYLEHAGYSVIEAANPEEAIEAAKNHQQDIDLLLSDVVMPKMSGRQVAKHIRAMHDAIKVIYMSGYTEDEMLHHGITSTDEEFIQKPFSVESLSRKIKAVLAKSE